MCTHMLAAQPAHDASPNCIKCPSLSTFQMWRLCFSCCTAPETLKHTRQIKCLLAKRLPDLLAAKTFVGEELVDCLVATPASIVVSAAQHLVATGTSRTKLCEQQVTLFSKPCCTHQSAICRTDKALAHSAWQAWPLQPSLCSLCKHSTWHKLWQKLHTALVTAVVAVLTCTQGGLL